MSELLYIKTSANGERSRSSQLCEHFIRQRLQATPETQVIQRDLVSEPLPHLGPEQWDALRLPPSQLSAAQLAYRRCSDRLIAEFDRADTVVIALPLYNAGIPSQLKAYFDLLARAGISFEFTEQGPRGLLRDKDLHLIATRGGSLAPADDHQIPAVKQLLGLLGITRIHSLIADGLDLSPDSREVSLTNAYERLAALA
ncbi:FMN-dependent NADH-azoreductase [Marinobacterium zhoushanense]|uniref:FMN dependent NADH:quinone oxidoreductase n=1 Tax=Marinobacterium zhoushanense TaxID=1679163 RepID=A0ABQ1KN26_9GAMM|nr:NAD(P)H-dependent oxidoreductase [Marinobacterium zhoushanense]GGC05113.1 FMN-dependent NADH-azoreductase [Marinobacterium zhoushanense]